MRKLDPSPATVKFIRCNQASFVFSTPFSLLMSMLARKMALIMPPDLTLRITLPMVPKVKTLFASIVMVLSRMCLRILVTHPFLAM